jgi:uncharacterized protein
MPATFKSFVERHALAVFIVLAYALSWWPWVWTIASPETSPSTILPCGPFFAAVIVLAVLGRNHLMEFLRRILHWRVAPRWYAVVLLLPAAVTIVAVLLNIALGAESLGSFETPAPAQLVVRFLFIFVFIGLGEEPAWRGFALPRLLKDYAPLVATLILGIVHLLWHLPLLGVEYDASNVLPWALALLGYSVIVTWLYLNTGGSLLLPALMHAAVNTSAVLFQMFNGRDLIQLWWLFSVLWVLSAIFVVALYGSSLRTGKHAPAM